MALIHSFESDGNFLFKYRGQIPALLFLAAIPVVYFTDLNCCEGYELYFTIFCIILSLLGFWVRAITIGTTPKGTSGRNTQKQVADFLNDKGIYSVVRHPLYLGNYLMWIGIVAYTANFWYVLTVSLAYWIYYERIMFAEERFLERKFGERYLEWSKKVPAFVPAFSKHEKGDMMFSLKTIFRREYSGVLATVLGFVFVDVLRDFFHATNYERSIKGGYILCFFIVLALVLRTLKHHTKLLHEDDRS